METISIRKADKADIKEIVELVNSLPSTAETSGTETIHLLAKGNTNIVETIISNQVTSEELNVYIATMGSSIVGMVYMNRVTNYVGHFYVKNNPIQVQKALLETIISEAGNYSLTSLVVKTHIDSNMFIKVLENCGFTLLSDDVPVDKTLFYVKRLTK